MVTNKNEIDTGDDANSNGEDGGDEVATHCGSE